jgi:glycosyltransferase involved in cell wall biosynthesis
LSNQGDSTHGQIRWSIVVPAYNAKQSIRQLLTSLEHQDVPRDNYEIIVVDDGSKDGTEAVVREFPNVALLKQQNRGPSAARNLGAWQAKGEIILFTDSDCEAASDWISQMVAPMEDPTVVGVKGSYLTRQSSLVARFIQVEYEEKYRKMSRKESIDFIDTYAAAYRKDVFVKYKGFSEEIWGAEDVEFSFRLSQDGLKMVFNSRAIVYHLFAEDLKVFLKKKLVNGYWRFLVVNRHRDKILRDSHTPQVQKPQIALSLVGLACLLLGVFWHPMWYGTLAAFVLHQISSLPFQFRVLRKDFPLFLASFVFLPLRSLALGLGMLGGALSLIAGRCKIGD